MQHEGDVPSEDDPVVAKFLDKWELTATPTRLKYENLGYAPAFCHVSAKHRAKTHKGRRVHGWALWKFGPEIVADHHSVWEDEDGTLVDLTPPSNGGCEVLFVRDDSARITATDAYIRFLVQRTSDEEVHWLWKGEPLGKDHWFCPVNKPDLVAYAGQLKLPLSAIATDDEHG